LTAAQIASVSTVITSSRYWRQSRNVSSPAKEYAARGSLGAGSLVAINSGANLNFDRLRHIAERGRRSAPRRRARSGS
jgi:threonine dehydratase